MHSNAAPPDSVVRVSTERGARASQSPAGVYAQNMEGRSSPVIYPVPNKKVLGVKAVLRGTNVHPSVFSQIPSFLCFYAYYKLEVLMEEC